MNKRDLLQAEDELRIANRALRVHSECSKAIARSESERELLEQVCQVITGAGGYRLAWIGYAEEDAERSIRPAAQVGFAAGHIESLRLSWAETEAGLGPSGQAIRSGRPIVARNIPTDPRYAGWRRADAEVNGYSSVIALPLCTGGRTFGTLGIYSDEPDAFDAAETELLSDLASDLAYGIAGLRERGARLEAEQARRAAEAELRREHDLLLSIVNNLPDHVCLKDGQGRYLFANSAKLADMGLSGLEGLIGRTSNDFYPAERAGQIAEHNRRMIGSGKPEIDREIKWRRPDGSLEWRLSSDIPLLDAQGNVTGLVAISRDISELGRAAELLEKSLREKETLLKELQHRVKNNLSLVSSLLSLELNHLPDEHSRRVFVNAQSRIRSMAAIYERLYRSADLGSVDLHLYIKDLAGVIFATYAVDDGRVRLSTALAELKLDLRRAVPLGLMLNEMISNALKHAFPDGRSGEIKVELAKNDDGTVTVRVSDDGAGLPEDFNVDSSDSFGLKLLKVLAGQIGGSFSAERSAGKGSSLAVVFGP